MTEGVSGTPVVEPLSEPLRHGSVAGSNLQHAFTMCFADSIDKMQGVMYKFPVLPHIEVTVKACVDENS